MQNPCIPICVLTNTFSELLISAPDEEKKKFSLLGKFFTRRNDQPPLLVSGGKSFLSLKIDDLFGLSRGLLDSHRLV